MRSKRFFFFLIAIAIGAAIGLAYGWVLNPPPSDQLALDTLKYDYKTDYVLMTAEVFRQDNNLGAAVKRLTLVEDSAPDVIVAAALLNARDLKYDPADMQTLAFLAQALQVNQPEQSPPAETPAPETAPAQSPPAETPTVEAQP
jgi:hypothetical protein